MNKIEKSFVEVLRIDGTRLKKISVKDLTLRSGDGCHQNMLAFWRGETRLEEWLLERSEKIFKSVLGEIEVGNGAVGA